VDQKFMEFWGTFLINAAKGQKHFDDMAKWMTQGFNGFDELTTMFNKFYGLEHLEKGSPDYMDSWKRASEHFQKSFKDYLRLMGVVPKDEHLNLLKKYEALKRKLAAQEETIRKLRGLLEDKGLKAQGELVKGFQDIVEKQTEQFHETMETFGKFFKKENNQS
jgi:hypothetical protein